MRRTPIHTILLFCTITLLAGDVVFAQDDVVKMHSWDEKYKSVVYVVSSSESTKDVAGAVHKQMKDSIKDLSVAEGQTFNLITFGDKNASLFKSELKAPTPENQKAAEKFIDAMPNTGKSNPTDAMKMAIKQKPEMIYLMLDGLSENVNIEDLQKAIDKADPKHKIRIRCVYLQPDKKDDALVDGLKEMCLKTGECITIIKQSEMRLAVA